MDNLVQTLTNEASLWLPRLAVFIVICIIFVVLARISRGIINNSSRRLGLDRDIVLLLARTSNVAIAIVGLITALGTLGINVSALVAGLGLTGFAFGFALKDSVSNLLSGVLILLYRPFKTGDRISLSGYEGNVISIDLRYTELDSDGNRVLIPNSKLFTDPITVHK